MSLRATRPPPTKSAPAPRAISEAPPVGGSAAALGGGGGAPGGGGGGGGGAAARRGSLRRRARRRRRRRRWRRRRRREPVQGLVADLQRVVYLLDPLLALGYALIDGLGLGDISFIGCHSDSTTIGSGGSVLQGPNLLVYVRSGLILTHVAGVHVLDLLDTYVARTRGVHSLGARSWTARLLCPGGGACHQHHRQQRG